MKHSVSFLLCALLCAPVSALSAQAHPLRYRITNLGTLPGYQASYATCLNDSGQVAGNMASSLKRTVAFLWKNGYLYKLPFVPDPQNPVWQGAGESTASGINNRGQIVGVFVYEVGEPEYTVFQAVVWNRRGAHRIPFPGQDDQSTAIAINDAGQVAYTADDVEPSHQGSPSIFLLSKGRSICLGSGTATGINNSGQISGYVTLDRYGRPDSSPVDYSINEDTPQPVISYALLCQPKNGKRTLGLGYALNVNNSGNVIGGSAAMPLTGIGWDVDGAVSNEEPLQLRGQIASGLAAQGAGKLKTTISDPEVLWRTGHGRSRAVALPFHWLPQAINNKGWIVGSHYLWKQGRQYDLNALIRPHDHWKIVCATAINQRGQIAGWGYAHGQPRAFLLTPKHN